jgi:Nucleoside permease
LSFQTEAPLLIKPYLPDLTRSELTAVMLGGFSTVAGTVFAAYTSLGVQAAHIITASIMTAPSALSYSKILYPETEISKTTISNIKKWKR